MCGIWEAVVHSPPSNFLWQYSFSSKAMFNNANLQQKYIKCRFNKIAQNRFECQGTCFNWVSLKLSMKKNMHFMSPFHQSIAYLHNMNIIIFFPKHTRNVCIVINFLWLSCWDQPVSSRSRKGKQYHML